MFKQIAVAYWIILAVAVVEAKADPLPPEIAKLRQDSFSACREAGGKPSVDNKYIQTADFNGDGRPDYVVNDEGLNCASAPSIYCGSGGCSIELYISTASGYRSANLQRLGFGAQIKQSSKGPILIVGGRNGSISYRWNGTALQPTK